MLLSQLYLHELWEEWLLPGPVRGASLFLAWYRRNFGGSKKFRFGLDPSLASTKVGGPWEICRNPLGS